MLYLIKRKYAGWFAFQILFVFSNAWVSLAQEEQMNKEGSGYAVSINSGVGISQTDIKPLHLASSFGAGFHYTAMRYLDFNLNVQKGTFKAGGKDFYKSLPEFKNEYFYIAFSLRFYPLGIIDNGDKDNVLTLISKVYVGTGIGYLKSNTASNTNVIPEWGPLGRYHGSDLFVPLGAGITFPFARIKRNNLLFNINYSVNLCFSDEIDGYVPTVSANKWRDAFSVLSFGLGLKF